MGAIINNLAGYGVGSGKTDEYGLPVFEAPDMKNSIRECEMHQSIEAETYPLSYAFPLGASAHFVITNGVNTETPLATANFFDHSVAPITAGWKRGLWVLAPALAVSSASIMVRRPVAGYTIKYSIETLDCSDVLWESPEIDGGADCGKNQVFEFPTMVNDGLAALFIEVIAAPEGGPGSCCPFEVSARFEVKDYSHESFADTCITCCGNDCKDCECTNEYKGFTPATVAK